MKSAAGNAGEHLAGDVQRHLDTWPQLRHGETVAGGVLVVNQQHRLPPHERAAEVYRRPEFVAGLQFPVISTRVLFEWWRVGNWTAIRGAVIGENVSDAFCQAG